MKKRVLALVMAMVLIFSMLPAVTFAATNDTRYLKLMGNTDKELLLKSEKGAPVYTKNVPATFTDESGAEFSGWAQELTTVTDEATDEWNLKFYYNDSVSRWTAVLKGAKLDAYNDQTKQTVKDAYCLVGVGSESYSYDFRLEIHQDSYLEGRILLMGYGSNRWTSVNILSENNATLYGKATYYGIYMQRSVYVNANLECYGNANSFIYSNNSDTNRTITINGGNIKLDNFYQLSSAKTYPLKLNGGTITLTNATAFAKYSTLTVKEGLCYRFADLEGNTTDLASLPVNGGVKFESYPQHILEGDNSDCTVASVCTICGAQTEARSEHEAGEDDGDCTTAITCLYCDYVFTEGKTAHEAGADDDNCATPVKCVNCDKNAVEGKDHTPGEDDGNCLTPVKCANCEQYATQGEAQHTPGQEPVSHDPASCTEAGKYIYKCDKCEETFEVPDPVKGHDHKIIDALAPTANSRGYNTYKCEGCGDTYTEELYMLPTVAMIGKVRYTSLQDAVDAAVEGDIIKLMSNKKDMPTVVIPTGKKITIDFNGKYYAVSQVSQAAALVVEAGAEVKLIDSVGGGKLEAMYAAYTQFNTVVNNAGNLTVENVILNGNNLAVAGSATMVNSGTLRLKVGTVVNVNRTTKNSLINTGEFFCESNSILPAPEGSHWNTEGKLEAHTHIPTQMPATVYEVAYILYKCDCGNQYKVPFGTAKLGVAAKIGDKLYATLQEAVDMAENGDTIVLNKNLKNVSTLIIPAGKKITIDMNGKYYAVSIVKQGAALVIEEGAELTLVSTQAASKLEAMSAAHKEFTCAVINNGKLTLENVTINGNNLLKSCDGVIVNNGEVTLERGARIAKMKVKNDFVGEGAVTENGITTQGQLTSYKTSSHAASITVNPGKTVTYSIVVTNNGTDSKTVTVTDEIPAVAEYVSGCDSVSGNQLKWEFTLGAQESKTVTYTLKAKNDEANLGMPLSSNAKVNGTALSFYDIFVERTLGKEDQRIMETAIDAFRQYTALKDTKLLKMIYYVAYSVSVSYEDADGNFLTPVAILKNVYEGGAASGGTTGEGEEAGSAAVNFRNTVIPTLYGGSGVTAAQMDGLKGRKAAKVTTADLMTGDIILVQESADHTTGKLYIYNGIRLFQLADGVIEVDTEQVLNGLTDAYRYAGLRVCMVMENRISYKDELTDTLTEAQKAVIATAEAYVLRGDRGQYDAGKTMQGTDKRYEWGDNSPEDYTSDAWKYTNCANLTYDALYFGVGYDSGANWYTSKIIGTAKSQGIYYYEPTGNETAEEQQELRDRFFQTLQPGDVICIRRANDSGHALLYIGNGKIIHSTGGSYKLPNDTSIYGVEQYEATFRYLNAENFFEAKCDSGTAYTYYLFGGKVTKIGIYRPLKSFNGEIPQESLDRMNNLHEIAVEKVASASFGQTVNTGDTLTYTFKFLNASNTTRTLNVTDVIPAGTTLVSASGWTVDGSNLTREITIPAGEKLEISYTVEVGADVPGGKLESKSAKVGGVSVRSSDIYVANTLTAEQQQILIDTVNALSDSDLVGLELANEIFKVAFGVENLFQTTDMKNFHTQLYVKKEGDSRYSIADNAYGAMVVPGLYGGRNFETSDDGVHGWLSRLPREENLVVGDIFFGRGSSANYMFIYLGNGISWSLGGNSLDSLDMNGRMERAFGYKNYWAVLRPSITFQEEA